MRLDDAGKQMKDSAFFRLGERADGFNPVRRNTISRGGIRFV